MLSLQYNSYSYEFFWVCYLTLSLSLSHSLSLPTHFSKVPPSLLMFQNAGRITIHKAGRKCHVETATTGTSQQRAYLQVRRKQDTCGGLLRKPLSNKKACLQGKLQTQAVVLKTSYSLNGIFFFQVLKKAAPAVTVHVYLHGSCKRWDGKKSARRTNSLYSDHILPYTMPLTDRWASQDRLLLSSHFKQWK